MNASYRTSAWRMTQGFVALACVAAATAVEAQTPRTVSAVHPVTVTAPAGTSQAEPGERTGAGQPEPNDTAHQGVKVHGHWAIDVKNADGTLAKHVEFENSLVSGGNGDQLLALTLTGRMVAADWGISVRSAQSLCNAGGETACVGVSTLNGLVGQALCSGNQSAACTPGTMAVPVRDSTSGVFSILITGTVVPQQAGNITTVQTQLAACNDSYNLNSSSAPGQTSISPKTCAASSEATLAPNGQYFALTFTQTSNFTPIPVAVGQTVAVTVTISFS